MWTKYTGALFVKLSGLGMGYEGAFVHCISVISHNITKLPMFKSLKNYHDRKVITIAGIAMSMVLTFGTPIGSVLFSIEMSCL